MLSCVRYCFYLSFHLNRSEEFTYHMWEFIEIETIPQRAEAKVFLSNRELKAKQVQIHAVSNFREV